VTFESGAAIAFSLSGCCACGAVGWGFGTGVAAIVGTGVEAATVGNVSILVLLLTLSAQITRISGVVADMNTNFTSVSDQMHQIRQHMVNMEQRVALLEEIDQMSGIMGREMVVIEDDMSVMQDMVHGISAHLRAVRSDVGSIAVNMDLMNNEVHFMGREMHRMAKPARSLNKMFPFP